MALYEFEREDGSLVEKSFPMGECPKEIVCEDGVVAHRSYTSPGVSWSGGGLPGGAMMKLNADMKARQERAGKRMRDNWQSVKTNK